MKQLSTLITLALLAAPAGACSSPTEAAAAAPQPVKAGAPDAAGTTAVPRLATFERPSDAAILAALTPLQFRVTQKSGTEPPFQNAYWDNKRDGLYVDIVSGEPLFSSRDKFASGTGWPSFTRPFDPRAVTTPVDSSHGMRRVEARSAIGNSHLGHVFNDGPAPGGERWCINSASLRFIPVDALDARGYGFTLPHFQDAAGHSPAATPRASTAQPTPADPTVNACTEPAPGQMAGCASSLEVALLAGGCFWGMEELLRDIPGVLDTEVGYTGGHLKQPEYSQVSGGQSGHAESVRVVFDPALLTFETLLERWFFRMHDPTTMDRQGNDRGSQYRSAIFYTSEAQARVARAVRSRVANSGKWKDPIVTKIVKAGTFTPAEDYHQDYLERNPGGYTCHYLR